jgi:hypothetical protein
VQGWKDELDPKVKVGRLIDSGMDAADVVTPVVDALAGGVADTIPFVGTYRLCSRGDAFGCGMSVVADVLVVMKLIRAGRYLVTLERLTRGDTSVYRSINAAKQIQYAGITNNIARRAVEHLAQRGFEIEKLIGDLSRSDARAVEQALIEIHGLGKDGGALLNRINSIAKSNPIYAKALRRGYEPPRSIGYE